MNETLKQFKENQKRNQENLNKLLDFIQTGEKYGIKIEESFKAKINSAIQSTAKLRVAGGFSEGKTSIAAAWIERLDKSMKIDHQESSDAVKIYGIDNEIELVGTPGLFGFKEK
ncbi:labile enterotoxin outputA [Helicobacter pylori]